MEALNILITGGAGYVGSVLIPKLISQGHYIKCLDRFFFGDEYLSSKKFESNLDLIRDDIRWFEPKILDGIDVVLDLAALSNDPIGELNPEKTFEINHLGRVRVAKLSKKFGVKLYVLASSASIYGQQNEIVDENSQVFPITAYSKANRKAEVDVLPLNDSNFSVSSLRFASIYGISPRMRFDISVNSMVLDLYKTGKIVVRGKNNRRPFLHINDAVEAYQKILKTNIDIISGQIFNVGSDDQNFEIGRLAKKIATSINKDFELELGNTNDHRSYTTSFKKIREKIGFIPKYSLEDGAQEIFQALERKEITDSIKSITLKWYKHILNDKKMFEKLSINGKIL